MLSGRVGQLIQFTTAARGLVTRLVHVIRERIVRVASGVGHTSGRRRLGVVDDDADDHQRERHEVQDGKLGNEESPSHLG